ncbi:MAG: SDR family oxidoreductase [Planctomycetes bacterium]|nr:SDR family oxidoreductase [Planctomycetota bacterium]
MKDLKGRLAIITGASAGLGVRVARVLGREGMNLVLAARSADALEAVAAEVRALGVKAIAVPTDVSDESQLQRLVERSVAEFGAIDVLVNNAGIEAFRAFHEIDPADIRRTIDVNLTATLLLTRYVLPHMVQARRGHIVNMASLAGKQGPAYGAAYGATKAGMIAFTQSLRSEYHGKGVSASAVCPGFASDGGIYEVIRQRIGHGTPWYVGSTTAEAVSRAVVKAIKQDRPDLIVNSPALRPLFTFCQAFPRLGEWIVRKSTIKFLKQAGTSQR